MRRISRTIIITLVSFTIFGFNLSAGQIYLTKYKSDSDANIYITKYKSDAHIIVYLSEYKSDASGNEAI
ncbi:MAG: hypothetical protein KAR14_04935, partial [Candidatus Aminicenantes bacterium]|nr:hypothetical protein [Candidatus Aminicenantes bacterium]